MTLPPSLLSPGSRSRRRRLAALACAAAAGLSVASPFPAEPDWPRPGSLGELLADPALFRAFADQVSGDVERALAAGPAASVLPRLLSLRVHLGLHRGDHARALAAATRIRETQTPPAERAFAGLLTEASVVARSRSPRGSAAPDYPEAFRAELAARLAALPDSPELTAVLARQRDRFRAFSAEALGAEARALAARLDPETRWRLADVDDVVRIGHRRTALLPLRDVLLEAFDAALAVRRTPQLPP